MPVEPVETARIRWIKLERCHCRHVHPSGSASRSSRLNRSNCSRVQPAGIGPFSVVVISRQFLSLLSRASSSWQPRDNRSTREWQNVGEPSKSGEIEKNSLEFQIQSPFPS